MPRQMAVLLPEKAIVTFRLANFVSRFLAQALDLTLVLFAIILLASGLASLQGIANFDLALVEFILPPLAALGFLAYFVLMEGLWNGQTLGKRALGLKVAMDDGRPVTFAGALARNLLRPADALPGFYLVGLLAIFMNPKSQRLGDLAARTVVIQTKRADPRFSLAPHTYGEHAFERYVGDLRGMTQTEYTTLRRLCDRFPELPEKVQTRLLREVWTPIANRRKIERLPGVHDLYLMEAAVMKYGRTHGLL